MPAALALVSNDDTVTYYFVRKISAFHTLDVSKRSGQSRLFSQHPSYLVPPGGVSGRLDAKRHRHVYAPASV